MSSLLPYVNLNFKRDGIKNGIVHREYNIYNIMIL